MPTGSRMLSAVERTTTGWYEVVQASNAVLNSIARLKRELVRDGFAWAPELAPALPTGELARMLGEPLAIGAGGPVHRLTPTVSHEASANSYSGLYGLGRFPMHTDMAHWHIPPRYLMLRCVRGAAHVATYLRDSRPITFKLGIDTLCGALVRPRRPLRGKVQLLHLLETEPDGDRLFRWDQTFLEPATAASREISLRVHAELDAEPDAAVVSACPADTLVVDNWRMVLARSPVSHTATDRMVERVYIGDVQ
jgi:L-asparagine oxygenase